jgi:hypothetical protein
MQEMTMDEIEQVEGGLILELLGIGVVLLWVALTEWGTVN